MKTFTRRAALRGGAAAASVAAVASAAAAGLTSASTADPASEAAKEFRIALAHSVQLERNVAENDPGLEFSKRYVGSDLVKSREAFQGAFNRLTTVEASSTAGVSALLGCITARRAACDDWDEWSYPVYLAGYRSNPFFTWGWPDYRVVANAHAALNRLRLEG
jgi:hypothetical protein